MLDGPAVALDRSRQLRVQIRKALRLDHFEASQHFRRTQPQIQRRVNHARLKTGILEEYMFEGQRQRRGEKVAFAEPTALQVEGERRGDVMQGSPVGGLSAIIADNGWVIRSAPGPPGQNAVQQMRAAMILLKVFQSAFRHATAKRRIHLSKITFPRQTATSKSPPPESREL